MVDKICLSLCKIDNKGIIEEGVPLISSKTIFIDIARVFI